ncbi:MAG: DMP19 family protein [Defluviitaleaceae bacterium]|nr:DMP19 family protein [Defluviitaleaceae bacterium]
MNYVRVYLNIDYDFIMSNDAWIVITPAFYGVDTCSGEKQYYDDLEKFTVPQRFVYAICQYEQEVNNGGHDQFYFNSTGIVWKDAMKGFEAIGATDNYDIIRQSADLLGGNPSLDWYKRQHDLDKLHPDFEELDKLFYSTEKKMLEKLNEYVRKNAKDFYFKGKLKVLKVFADNFLPKS